MCGIADEEFLEVADDEGYAANCIQAILKSGILPRNYSRIV